MEQHMEYQERPEPGVLSAYGRYLACKEPIDPGDWLAADDFASSQADPDQFRRDLITIAVYAREGPTRDVIADLLELCGRNRAVCRFLFSRS